MLYKFVVLSLWSYLARPAARFQKSPKCLESLAHFTHQPSTHFFHQLQSSLFGVFRKPQAKTNIHDFNVGLQGGEMEIYIFIYIYI
jgi:hypothetical protein